jgi:hypothetical protein
LQCINLCFSAIREELGFKFPVVSAITEGDGSIILMGSLVTKWVGFKALVVSAVTVKGGLAM